MADERDQVTVSLVIETPLLTAVDARAQEMDLNRSQYLRRLAREDLERARQTPVADTPRSMRRAA